jgi:hypothetical protein
MSPVAPEPPEDWLPLSHPDTSDLEGQLVQAALRAAVLVGRRIGGAV